MELNNQLKSLADKIHQLKDKIETEEKAEKALFQIVFSLNHFKLDFII